MSWLKKLKHLKLKHIIGSKIVQGMVSLVPGGGAIASNAMGKISKEAEKSLKKRRKTASLEEKKATGQIKTIKIRKL